MYIPDFGTYIPNFEMEICCKDNTFFLKHQMIMLQSLGPPMTKIMARLSEYLNLFQNTQIMFQNMQNLFRGIAVWNIMFIFANGKIKLN
jgi:hypothetical protein